MPSIKVLTRPAGHTYIILILTMRYRQAALEESDNVLTAFSTPQCLCQFPIMPFDLVTTPVLFYTYLHVLCNAPTKVKWQPQGF